MAILAASSQSQLHATFAVLVVGLVIGIVGHVTGVRWLVLLGIVLIGLDLALFSFVLRPGSS